jgi:LmbE family N-acetylglucosaminyl deacetylase
MLRRIVKRIYLWLLDRHCGLQTGTPTSLRAIIFAPHQDDETIGCGGTILRKTALGADVTVVYMTDGCMSHSSDPSISPLSVANHRKREALSACSRLGINQKNIIFLEFPDGQLSKFPEAAAKRVADIIRAVKPSEIFIPYRHDRHADHEATNRVVDAALPEAGQDLDVYEYGVWLWLSWPLVSRQNGRVIGRIENLASFAQQCLHVLKDMRYAVLVEDVLDQKRRALEEHATQMTKILKDNSIKLPELYDGEFLELFFRRYELLHTWRFVSR